MSRITTLTIAAIAALLAPTGTHAAADEKPWSLELGSLIGRHQNLFFERNNVEDDSSFELYGRGDYEFELGPGDLRLSLAGKGVFFRDVDDADYQRGDLEARYKLGRTKLTGAYSHTRNRLYSEESDLGDPVFFDVDGYGLEVRRGLGRGWWIGAEGEIQSWDFDSSESERDATVTGGQATLRIPLLDGLALRLGALYASKSADADRYDWSGPGASVALEVRPSQRVEVFLRYKQRRRDYDHADAGDSNFGREDRIDDVVANVRWHLRDDWGLQLRGFYRWGDSTRRDRNYHGGSASAGFFLSY